MSAADRRTEILDGLKLADELKIKVVLSGATDAWKVADELRKRDVPVIVGPVMDLPTGRDDPYDAPYYHPGMDSPEIQYMLERRK